MLRRVWAPRGQRPTARVDRKYRWLYVYGFVRPGTGQTWWCLLPTVRTAAFELALAEFARDEGIDAAHRAVLVLDRAGWHASVTLTIPDGIDLVFQPAASPELQPAERLWPAINEPIANRVFSDLADLEDVLVARCRHPRTEQPAIQALTRYHWWPSDNQPFAN